MKLHMDFAFASQSEGNRSCFHGWFDFTYDFSKRKRIKATTSRM